MQAIVKILNQPVSVVGHTMIAHMFGVNDDVEIVRWTVSAPKMSRAASELVELFDDESLVIEIDEWDIEESLAA